MSSFLATLGYGCAALLGTAVLVAIWEHWRHGHVAKLPPAPPAGPTEIDVDLTGLNASPMGNDQAQRQMAVDTTLARMSRPPQPQVSGLAPWIETHPMVTLGPAVEPKGAGATPAPADAAMRSSEPH